MKSKTSFFDPTLLKKNVGRFAPAWALLFVALFLAFPMTLMRSISWTERMADRKAQAAYALENTLPAGILLAFGAALIFAALVFKYLHRTRDAYMMHAFPMTRTCMFVTNTVSGLLFWVVPTLLIGLCELGVLALYGVGGFDGAVWAVLGKWLLAFLFFYGLAVFTMHITGNSIIAVLSYGALNFVFLLIPVLMLMLIAYYFKGFDYTIPESLLRLAPLGAMLSLERQQTCWLLIYGAIGLGLLALAWVHYRVRQVERAGDAMVYPWARIAFRLVFTLCCTMGLGWLLAVIFGQLNGGEAFLPYALLGCFLGWFGASMMLERTVKVFRNKKIWLGFAAFAGVLILTVACLKYDLLGFQRRIPETAQVESVEIWTNEGVAPDRITLTAAADVDVVRAAHEKAMQHTEASRDYLGLFDSYSYGTIHIRYHLAGGGTLQRAYRLNLNDDYEALAALFVRPEIAEAWYARTVPEDFRRVTLEGVLDKDEDENGYFVNSYEEWECTDPAALREAILADAAAGRLPIVNFLSLNSDWFNSRWNRSQGYYFSSELSLWFQIEAKNGSGWEYRTISIVDTAAETIKLFKK
jgi:ABC-2 type transport system permease protein